LFNDYPITIGKLSTSQTINKLLLISPAWSTPPGGDGPGPCYTYLNPRIVIQCSDGERHAVPQLMP